MYRISPEQDLPLLLSYPRTTFLPRKMAKKCQVCIHINIYIFVIKPDN